MILLKKMWNQSGRPRPPAFDVGHDDLTAKHCYFEYLSPPGIDGIKIFNKEGQVANQ